MTSNSMINSKVNTRVSREGDFELVRVLAIKLKTQGSH